MKIWVNGEGRTVEAQSLAALWSAETAPQEPTSRRGFAIALNGEVVRTRHWDDTFLKHGDRVEIIRAMAGG